MKTEEISKIFAGMILIIFLFVNVYAACGSMSSSYACSAYTQYYGTFSTASACLSSCDSNGSIDEISCCEWDSSSHDCFGGFAPLDSSTSNYYATVCTGYYDECSAFDDLVGYFSVRSYSSTDCWNVDSSGNVRFTNSPYTSQGAISSSADDFFIDNYVGSGTFKITSSCQAYLRGSVYSLLGNSISYSGNDDFIIKNDAGETLLVVDGSTGNMYIRGFYGTSCGAYF